MKSWLCSVAILATLSILLQPTDASASRARNLVIGSGDGGLILGGLGDQGSFIQEDHYNIFYNPSYATDHKDWATIEKYDGVGAAAGGGLNGAAGGFMSSFASFTFGFFFNRAGAIDPSHFTGVTSGAANYRPLDFILAADLGVKVGLGLSYGSVETAGGDNEDLTVRLGAQIGEVDPFVHYQITGNNSTGASTDLLVGGVRYHWGEWNPVFAYRQHRTAGSTDSRRWGIGLSRFAEGTEGVRYGFSFSYWRDTTTQRTIVPFEIMIQGRAASWIVLRAGLMYPVVSRTGSVSNSDSTTGRIGATFTFGALEFDFAVGSGSVSTVIGSEGPVTTTGSIDNPSFGLDDSLFSAASLTYNW